MLIQHPNIVACQGYGYGAVQKPTEVYSLPGTNYAYLGERVFNVHPFREDVNGWPIRWELDQLDRGKLQADRDFWKSMDL